MTPAPRVRAAATGPGVTVPAARSGGASAAPAGAVRPQRLRRRRRRSARARRRRRVRVTVYSILGLAAFVAAISLIPGFLAGQALLRGRDAVDSGKGALLNLQDATKAAQSFAVAESAFDDASRWADNPLIRLEGMIPILGRTPDAIGRLAQAGHRIAVAGSALSEGIGQIRGGVAGLAPRNGRIPVDTIQQLLPAVARARTELEASDREVRTVSTSWVVPPVTDATSVVRTELAGALRTIRAADSLLRQLPNLAGVNGTRRYFLAAEDPAELRGTGGIIGLYSIVTIDDGNIHLGPFVDKPPPDAPDGSIPPPRGFGGPYTSFGSPTFWLNTNVTPDAPTAATMIENLWHKVKGKHLDGVIFVTPQALSSLMGALGPIDVPKLHYTVTADNVVQFVTNQAFFLLNKEQTARNRVLGLVASQVLHRFFAANHPQPAVKAMVEAASKGYIIVHAVDPAVESGFVQAGIAGGFGPDHTDFFSVVSNNIAGNKVDYYVKNSIDYQVDLKPGGTASADVAVTLDNTAPSQSGYNEALGPYPTHRTEPHGLQLSSGEDYSFLAFYCSRACSGTATEPDGRTTLARFPQDTMTAFAGETRLKPKTFQTFHLNLSTPGGWTGNDVGGTYRLVFQAQPTIQAAFVRFAIALPPGMRMVSTNIPVTFDKAGRLLWEGTIGRTQEIDIRFERPLLEKLWVRTKDFLSRPVFKIG